MSCNAGHLRVVSCLFLHSRVYIVNLAGLDRYLRLNASSLFLHG